MEKKNKQNSTKVIFVFHSIVWNDLSELLKILICCKAWKNWAYGDHSKVQNNPLFRVSYLFSKDHKLKAEYNFFI